MSTNHEMTDSFSLTGDELHDGRRLAMPTADESNMHDADNAENADQEGNDASTSTRPDDSPGKLRNLLGWLFIFFYVGLFIYGLNRDNSLDPANAASVDVFIPLARILSVAALVILVVLYLYFFYLVRTDRLPRSPQFRWELNTEGLVQVWPHVRHTYFWNHMDRYEETETLFVVAARRKRLIVPKRAMNDGQIEHLRDTLQMMIDERLDVDGGGPS